MQRPAQLDLDLQLCFPLYAASRALTRAYAPLLEPVGLTYPQYLAMLALWSADGAQSVTELSRRLRLDAATLTPLLKRLESRGLVDRRRDPADDRRVLVSPTAAGTDLQGTVAHIPAALIERAGLSFDDGVALRRILHALLETLDESPDQPDLEPKEPLP